MCLLLRVTLCLPHSESSSSPQAKDGAEQDARKPFAKRGSKAGDATDFPSAGDAQPLDPISEEDEKLDHSSSSRTPATKKKGGGALYHKLPNDDDSGPEEADNTTPLLQRDAAAAAGPGAIKPGFLSDMGLDKKDSSDSGMRSSDSSSDHSLEESDGDKGPAQRSLLELELEVKKRVLLPSSLSGLQDAAVARMSICSEAASEASLMASSPDDAWPSSGGGVCNLNRTDSNATLNNNTSDATDNSRTTHADLITGSTSPADVVIITPGTGSGTGATTATASIHNQNLRSISLGDERESVL